MENKTAGIVATIVTILFCGLPGLASLCFGLFATILGFFPNFQRDSLGVNNPNTAFSFGIVFLCLGIVFIAIPIVVGILTLRNRPTPPPPPPQMPEEPIPPAS